MPRRDAVEDWREAIASGRWFQSVPAAFGDALLEHALVRHLGAGDVLFRRGDPFDGVYCIVRGALRITGSLPDGREALLTFVEPVNWFGEVALFDRLARTHDVTAYLPSTVIQVPEVALDRLLKDHPAYWRWCGLLLSGKMRFAFTALEEHALLSVPVRVARRLVVMAEGYGELSNRSRRSLPVSQEQLAIMLALSRQTVNQTLREFQSQGLIQLQYRRIEVTDLSGLRTAAAFE